MFNFFKKKNKFVGSSFDEFLSEEDIKASDAPIVALYKYKFSCYVHCMSGDMYSFTYESVPYHQELTLEEVIDFTMRSEYLICNEGVVPRHNIKFLTNIKFESKVV
jgi:hypothetical protein